MTGAYLRSRESESEISGVASAMVDKHFLHIDTGCSTIGSLLHVCISNH